MFGGLSDFNQAVGPHSGLFKRIQARPENWVLIGSQVWWHNVSPSKWQKVQICISEKCQFRSAYVLYGIYSHTLR